MKHLLPLLLCLVSVLRGADFYIAQTATGSGSGHDASNCLAYTFFTNAVNWNGATGTTICSTATKDTIRDTIHLVGTISNQLAWPYPTGTGAAGLLIFFEPNAKLSSATWPGGAINWESAAYAKANVTIDGGTNGVIECTANGTLLANHVTSAAISTISASHLTIQNLTISNIYVRVNDSSNDQVDGGSGIYNSTGDGAYTDFVVQNCTIHDINIGINAPYTAGSSNYSFLNNTIYNINWGIGSGSAGSNCTMSNWLADGCYIHDFANWDAPIGFEAFHHNGIFLFGNSSTDNFGSATIRNCKFGPNFGTRATAGIYLSSYGMQGTYLVYNNRFLGSPSNGLISIGTSTGSTTRFYNNTIVNNNMASFGCIGIGGSSSTSNQNVYLENNVCSGAMFINGNTVGPVNLHSNHNLNFNFGANVISWSGNINSAPISWATWTAFYGQDANSVYNQDPLLNGSYALQTGSPAIGAGSDQSTYFTTDALGVTRTNPWDIGWLKYNGSSAPSITLQPLSQSIATGANATFTATASGSPAPTWQWSKGGTPIGGATSSTYVITGVVSGDAGNYSATATNSVGSATTSTATLTVTSAPPIPGPGVPGTPIITGVIP